MEDGIVRIDCSILNIINYRTCISAVLYYIAVGLFQRYSLTTQATESYASCYSLIEQTIIK